jgi:nucleotide-binding universal stress UspA family protein
MFQSILVPVDGSEPSARAVALAVQVAQMTKARILFAHVINADLVILETGAAPFVDPQPAIDGLKKDGQDALAAATAEAKSAGVSADAEQVEGDPVKSIAALADKRTCDLIVMGSHGRRGLSRLFLGSVTEGVLRHSHVPVLCVRAEAHASTDAPSETPAAGSVVYP